MQNANQIHEFIKLVYQYNLNWLWFIVIKVIQFQSNPQNEFFFFKCSDKKLPLYQKHDNDVGKIQLIFRDDTKTCSSFTKSLRDYQIKQ